MTELIEVFALATSDMTWQCIKLLGILVAVGVPTIVAAAVAFR